MEKCSVGYDSVVCGSIGTDIGITLISACIQNHIILGL